MSTLHIIYHKALCTQRCRLFFLVLSGHRLTTRLQTRDLLHQIFYVNTNYLIVLIDIFAHLFNRFINLFNSSHYCAGDKTVIALCYVGAVIAACGQS